MLIRSLERSDVREGFRCGEPSLDRFLERYAWQNEKRYHLGVTYVAVDDVSRRVLGYFTLVAAALTADGASPLASGGYAELPVIRIARLAVDRRAQGIGIGQELVRAACIVANAESERVGCAAVVVDALPESVGFYAQFGFRPMTVVAGGAAVRPRPVCMYLGVACILRALEQHA